MQSDLSEQFLTRDELLALRNRRLGMTIFQISWMMVFVCLVVVNLQLRSSFAQWPPEGVAELGIAVPTLATVILLSSAVLARRALRAVRRDHLAAFYWQWLAVIGLGIVFVGLMAVEWLAASLESQYGAVFRLMTGFHAVHALVIGGYLFTVYQNARAGQVNALHFWAVEAGVKLWYFVAFAWMMFYVVLYWV